MRYRKKPVVVEAREWTGSNALSLVEWAGGALRLNGTELIVRTLEGDHRASIGDMVIKGVAGEFYACKPDIFAKTYDREDQPATGVPQPISTAPGDGEPDFLAWSPLTRSWHVVYSLMQDKNGDTFGLEAGSVTPTLTLWVPLPPDPDAA
jgi:hypothetical protein